MNTKNQELKVNILEYSNEYASDFARLNYEWLNQYFGLDSSFSDLTCDLINSNYQ